MLARTTVPESTLVNLKWDHGDDDPGSRILSIPNRENEQPEERQVTPIADTTTAPQIVPHPEEK